MGLLLLLNVWEYKLVKWLSTNIFPHHSPAYYAVGTESYYASACIGLDRSK